jgi:hypothetical protein
MLNQISLKPLFELRFLHPRGSRQFISAASGLAVVNESFYTIADDDLTLDRLNFSLQVVNQSVPLLTGSLPEDQKLRKKVKPDWESLCYDPKTQSLLVIPSGSKENRTLGLQVLIHPHGNHQIKQLDFGPLFSTLSKFIEDLNLEGACFLGSSFYLFQRGNSARGRNMILRLNKNLLWKSLLERSTFSVADFKAKEISLPELNGAQLTFTDGFAGRNGFYFLASAEKTDSTYDDGEYTGSVLGFLSPDLEMQWSSILDCPLKPEGLVVIESQKQFYVVTDADSKDICSQLYQGKIP